MYPQHNLKNKKLQAMKKKNVKFICSNKSELCLLLGKMLGKVMRKPSGIGSERGKNVLSKDGR
jgi:hypothetical protein